MPDCIIIGGGPAGLSAALNAAAEGLDIVLLERSETLGGQAGTSSRIENYMGFSEGVAGADLCGAAADAATRLGADLRTNSEVVSLAHSAAGGLWVAECAGGTKHVAASVLVAVGVDYRRLPIPGGDLPMVRYGAPASAHAECEGKDVLVIGGGNSAGQAAMNLAHHNARVTLLVRRPLTSTMSRYLIERIITEPRITAVLGNTVAVREGEADVQLAEGSVVASVAVPPVTTLAVDTIFAYIGSEPRTAFLGTACPLDDKGFVIGHDYKANPEGLFVAGDVRSGSAKRVAVAAGEGSVSAQAVWHHIYPES